MKVTHPSFPEAPLARRMLEVSPAAVVVLDHQGVVVFVNEKLTQLLGYSSNELVGNPSDWFFDGTLMRDKRAQLARFPSHYEAGRTNGAEPILARCKNGQEVPINISRHHFTGLHEPFLLVFLARADTQPVNDAFLESERLAAITKMVSGLAHESRNALQRAVACLDLLELDLQDNPEQLVLSQGIRDSLADLLANYDEVKRYAEPMAVSPTRLELSRMCQLVFDEIVVNQDKRPHQLKISSLEEHDDVARVDREKLQLVIRHLMDNAIDAAGDHAARIEIHFATRQRGDKPVMTQTIRDHGCGFDPHTIDEVFEPFYTTKQHGTGLGLAICRRIVNAHHGEIEAANHPDGGALITIHLPIDAAKRHP